MKFDLRVPFFIFVLATVAAGQIASAKVRNNPYSPSPDGRTSTVVAKPVEMIPVTADSTASVPVAVPQRRRSAPVVERNGRPTETYKVGVGDVLLIEVANVLHGKGYYTVRETGTIDFQLAGGSIRVADKTADLIAAELSDSITLFSDPEVRVTVREYGSHKVNVSGLVDHAGEKNLRREAIPLYVIMAEAGVKPEAGRVLITRAPLLKPEVFAMTDQALDGLLIYPGNSVEFVQVPSGAKEVYFIAGAVVTTGQKELMPGLTLYQAIAAAGGSKGSPKRGRIRRKDDTGNLLMLDFNLRAIRDGRDADPPLVNGDIIEIGN